MRAVRTIGIACGLTLIASAALAGDGYLGFQVANGEADIAYQRGNPVAYVSAGQPHSEIGVGIQYWRMVTSDYAFNFSAGIGTFSETDKPSAAAGATAKDHKYTQSSYGFRFGGDRAVKIADRAVVYFGPGIEYWTGKAKFEGFGAEYTSDPYETAETARYGVSGRIGAIMLVGRSVGFNCQVGRYIAMASAEEAGAEATWWPSGFQASGGIVFRLPI